MTGADGKRRGGRDKKENEKGEEDGKGWAGQGYGRGGRDGTATPETLWTSRVREEETTSYTRDVARG
jgi:hypothetical protein